VRMGRWAYIGSLAVVLLVHASPLRAQAALSTAQDGSALLDAGEAAYASGRFGDALDNFEASYRTRPEPPTLRRIGDAADKLGSHARAIEAFRSYLAKVPDARDCVFIESRIEANRAALDAVKQQTLVAASSAKITREAKPDAPQVKSIVRAAPLQPQPEQAAPAAALTQTKSERAGSPAGPLWIWAAGGAVVVAGIVVAAVLIGSGAAGNAAVPVRGNVGSAIQTLSSR
jgi:tetratricopeptide (TPR) repeat protein